MAKVFSTDLEVFLEGRDELLTVTADQRDYAAWEAHPDAGEDNTTTRMRFLAWSAGKRKGQISATWREFNDRLCIQALVADLDEPEDEESEDEQGLDPGRRTASGV